MFEELGRIVDDLAVPPIGDAIVEITAIRDRIDAQIAAAVAQYEAEALHEGDGASSMTAWLADRCRMTGGQAGKIAKRARLAAQLPLTYEAWANGRLSAGQVDAIVGNLDRRTVSLFGETETDLVPTLAELSAKDVATVMNAWRDIATTDREPPPERPQRLHLSPTVENRWRLDGALDAETGELLSRALDLAETRDVEGEPKRSVAHRRADALGDMCRWFLDNRGTSTTRGRARPHLNLIIDGDRLADHEPTPAYAPDGTLFDHHTVERLLCDSSLHRVVMTGGSTILDYGRAVRTAPAPLWNALVVRDRHCRFPGCDRPPQWCEAHHLWWWEHGGPTKLENLVLLCVRHHHLFHNNKEWKARLLPDATLEVTDPKGRVRTSRPPGAHNFWSRGSSQPPP